MNSRRDCRLVKAAMSGMPPVSVGEGSSIVAAEVSKALLGGSGSRRPSTPSASLVKVFIVSRPFR